MSSERDALALAIFGAKWQAVADVVGKSKARKKLRRQAEIITEMRALYATGALCGNCWFMRFDKGHYCQKRSTPSRRITVHPDFVCVQYQRRPTSEEVAAAVEQEADDLSEALMPGGFP